ncbi:BnaAnng26540D [Brassica napus]|uniref:BnaAnng26540D protein n=1 Tax=Brassica napus TaxID=3708 RepID=A0A078JN40_BRANA|nr:BnaAnng26540D [Brassica napus]
MPDEAFLRNPRNMSRRPPSIRLTRAQDAQAPPLPDFPNIPDIPMQDQGDFQRFVVDALQAIWARVSCRSRRATGAQAPAPAAARRDPSPEDDEATDEDTD